MSATLKARVQFKLYRASTIWKALKALYTLPQEKVDAYVNSYEIYDHDWNDEKALIDKMGKDYYSKVKQKLIDCYCVWNHLCSIGQVEKMYIPPAIDLKASIIENQNLFERRMAKDLKLNKGKKALDIGCGRGRVASHISEVTGAHVTGINIDHTQLESAKMFTEAFGLTGQTRFQYHDLNEIPYPFSDASFDAIYHVQVFSICKDLLKLFKEIHRLLKPGGVFACLDWVHLDKYDEKNPEHVDLMRRVKSLVGAIGTPSIAKYTGLLQQAGFVIEVNENASIDGLQAPLIENADKFYTRAKKALRFLVKCRLVPKHFNTLFDRLTLHGEAFVEADRKRLLTTSHYIVARKK